MNTDETQIRRKIGRRGISRKGAEDAKGRKED
jgi:hypothetical protein